MVQRFGPQRRKRRSDADEIQQARLERQNDNLESKRARLLSMSLAEVGLSVRTVNTLEKQGILTVGSLVAKTRDELLQITNFGEHTLVECRQLLTQLEISTPAWNKPTRKKR